VKITVIGAGVVGVTTAYYLARDGHEVTVLDSAKQAAMLASGANAGFLAPNDSFAWASPAAPRDLARSIFGAPTGLKLSPRLDPKMVVWGLRFLRECTPKRTKLNSIAQLQVAKRSQDLQREIEAAEALTYHVKREGAFYLFRDAAALEAAAASRAMFEDYGVNQRVMSMDEVISLEPALERGRSIFAGGIYGIGDGAGDSETFTRELAAVGASKYGATFRYGTAIERLVVQNGRMIALDTGDGRHRADHYVLCAGVGSAALAGTAGIRLPIYPVKGYSATYPIKDKSRIPVRPSVEQTSLIAWSNLGDRFRMSSSAEVVGYDWTCPPDRTKRIRALAEEMFSDAIDIESGRYRACLRPMTPGGPPIVGPSRIADLFYNTGHGHLGWTMACATAWVTADALASA